MKSNIYLVIFFIISSVISGCSQDNYNRNENSVVAANYEELLSGINFTAWYPSENLKETYVVLDQENQFHTAFPNVSTSDPISQTFPPKELAQVDYCTDVAIILTPGHKQSGMHGIKIERLEISENKLVIKMNKSSYTEKSIQAKSFRFTLLKVSRQQLPIGNIDVVFVDQNGQVLKEDTFMNKPNLCS